jgi:hypothetical protein
MDKKNNLKDLKTKRKKIAKDTRRAAQKLNSAVM